MLISRKKPWHRRPPEGFPPAIRCFTSGCFCCAMRLVLPRFNMNLFAKLALARHQRLGLILLALRCRLMRFDGSSRSFPRWPASIAHRLCRCMGLSPWHAQWRLFFTLYCTMASGREFHGSAGRQIRLFFQYLCFRRQRFAFSFPLSFLA
jgi:hypothetical protein